MGIDSPHQTSHVSEPSSNVPLTQCVCIYEGKGTPDTSCQQHEGKLSAPAGLQDLHHCPPVLGAQEDCV